MFFDDLSGGVAVAFYPLGQHLAADIDAGFKLLFQSGQSFIR